MSKKGLGKGLEALIPSLDVVSNEQTLEIEIEKILPNPAQPRKNFDAAKLEELAQSIREHGLVQPIVVREAEGAYQIIAGERRWRAAKLAGLHKVPVVVKNLGDAEVLEIALIENIQREDLSPIEEALAYQRLLQEVGMTQEELAKRLGKSRSAITNTLRLLNLPKPIQDGLNEGIVTMGHARALLGLDEMSEQLKIYSSIIKNGLSVRETEKAVKKMHASTGELPGRKRKPNLFIKEMENQLRDVLGTGVRIIHKNSKGTIEIDYYSDEDLTRIYEIITKKNLI